jgi:glyoxylase-like metal-dependent hydrolase (beta-lactamase superfamily II)
MLNGESRMRPREYIAASAVSQTHVYIGYDLAANSYTVAGMLARVRGFVAALIGLIMPICSSADGPLTLSSAPARAVSFHLGSILLTSLQDGRVVATNDGRVFAVGVDPNAVSAVLRAAGAPTDRITLSTGGLLVRSGKRILLLDTGLGPKYHGALLQSLRLAGVSPLAITDVLITHSHADHIGGLLDEQGHLVFANAVVRMSSAEWAWLQQKGPADVVAVIAPHVHSFEPGARLAPGITAVDLPGHTPGSVGYEIVSGSSRLIDVGDMVHSSLVSLAKPEWKVAYDSDADVAAATRRTTLEKLAADHEWVYTPHFPYPGVGHIVAVGAGFAWAPGLP